MFQSWLKATRRRPLRLNASAARVGLATARDVSLCHFHIQHRRVFQNVCLGMLRRLASSSPTAFLFEALRRIVSTDLEIMLSSH